MIGIQSSRGVSAPGLRAAVLVLAIALLAMPGSLFAAGPSALQAPEEPISLLLGEYARQELAKGETASFSVFFPEEAVYMASPDDDEAAKALELEITDENGISEYSGSLKGSEKSYPAGRHILKVTATAKTTMSFFVLGRIGQMSDSDRAPGKLVPGSIYSEKDVSDSRFATLTIPATRYPQEVLLFLQGGAGDTFYMWADGEDVYGSMNTDETSLLRFWTGGGEYFIEVEPDARRSEFTLIVFLAGRPAVLPLHDEFDGLFEQDTSKVVYALEVDEVYSEISLVVDPGIKESGITMEVVDRYSDGHYLVWGEEQDDGTILAEMTNVLPGTYYVVLERSDLEELEFIVESFGQAGRPLQRLTPGKATSDEIVDSGEVHFYQLDDIKRGQVVRVTLKSTVEESDFDLAVGVAQPVDQWTSSNVGTDETVLLIAPNAGTYYVQVTAYTGVGKYSVLAEALDAAPMLKAGRLVSESVDPEGWVIFGFEVTEPGRLLSVVLVSDSSTDLDLAVTHFNSYGDSVVDLLSSSLTASEIVSVADPEPGIYEIRVDNYGDEDAEFVLLVRLEDPLRMLEGEIVGSDSRVFFDDFSDETSGWAELETAPGDSAGYGDEVYEMSVPIGGFRWSTAPTDLPYSDASIEVDAAMTSGVEDGYVSLICRLTPDGYVFMHVAPGGTFTIGRTEDKSETFVTLVDWTENDAILSGSGEVNALRLDCIGDSITAYANGVALANAPAGVTVAGTVGVGAGIGSESAKPVIATFDNFAVRKP